MAFRVALGKKISCKNCKMTQVVMPVVVTSSGKGAAKSRFYIFFNMHKQLD